MTWCRGINEATFLAEERANRDGKDQLIQYDKFDHTYNVVEAPVHYARTGIKGKIVPCRNEKTRRAGHGYGEDE